MTPAEWRSIKNFKPTEAWGDPGRMNVVLLRALDRLRDLVATPIKVTCGTQGAHTEDSEHYRGNAVDIIFPNIFVPRLFDTFLIASRIPEFKGIGLYPHWRVGGIIHGGLHLDVRDAKERSYWMGVPGDGGTKYLPLSAANLVTYGLIEAR